MIPTKLQVFQTAQFHLGDETGQIFSYQLLEQPFQLANRELARVLGNLAIPRVQTERFYDLPPNTSVLDPVTAGITDFREPERLEERSVQASVPISNAVIGRPATGPAPPVVDVSGSLPGLIIPGQSLPGGPAPVPGVMTTGPGYVITGSGCVTITTAEPHPFKTGDMAVLWGLGGMNGINGIFAVTVFDDFTFTANGVTVTGQYTSGGYASKSGEGFQPLTSRDHIEDLSLTGASTLGEYCWRDGRFWFIPNAGVRELRIRYISSVGIVSKLNDTTGFDDSLDYLSLRTAAYAAGSRGAPTRAQALNLQALGPTMQADGSGGVLHDLVVAAVRALQATPTRRPPFRQRINSDVTYYS